MRVGVDYIAADKQSAIRAGFGTYDEFVVGEVVGHQDDDAGQATIKSFEFSDTHEGEVKVWTDKGYAHLSFLEKIQ